MEDDNDDNKHMKIVYGSSYCGALVKEVVEGMKNGAKPYHNPRTMRGGYKLRNSRGMFVAVVKPSDEEPGAPNDPEAKANGRCLEMGQFPPGFYPYVRVGEGAYREVAVYLLDHHHFAKVPLTALVQINNVTKTTASLQQIIPGNHWIVRPYRVLGASYLESCVHRIGMLDIRICNLERHENNVMMRIGIGELYPYDHADCLPEALNSTYFGWSDWPQASTPFTEQELEYIRRLDPLGDADMLRKELPGMIREASLRVLVVCTIFLKDAASFGFCLSQIAEMMQSNPVLVPNIPTYSDLELVCIHVKTSILLLEHPGPGFVVEFADIHEDAWSLFLETFPLALRPVFHNHLHKIQAAAAAAGI